MLQIKVLNKNSDNLNIGDMKSCQICKYHIQIGLKPKR